MIVISGTIAIDPAHTDAAIAAITDLETATRAEAGCITYGFWLSPGTPGLFNVFEEWEDDDALNGHMGSDHMVAFLTAAGEFGITGTDISRYDVSAKTKFM